MTRSFSVPLDRVVKVGSAAFALAATLALGGCSGATYGMSQWIDPTELTSFLDFKKPLPGERKQVFPEGVPGVSKGVPQELYAGTQAEREKAQQEAAVEPPKPAKPTPAAKPKPRVRQAARPAPAPSPAPAPTQAAAPAAPAQSSGQDSAWPAPPGATRPAQPSAAQQVQWPAPPPSGSFSR